MDKIVSKNSRVHSEDNVIVLDSDSEEESPSTKKREPSVPAEIVDLDDDDDDQLDINDPDLIWGDNNTDQESKPSTSGVTEIRRPQYNLESSSSDDDSPTDFSEVLPKINQQFEQILKPKPIAPVIPQVPKIDAVRSKSESESKFEEIKRIHQIKSSPKKVALVQPKVQQPQPRKTTQHMIANHNLNNKKRSVKAGKPSVYMPISVNPKQYSLRQQIIKTLTYLPNSASNFSLNSTSRMNGHSHAQKLLNSAKKGTLKKPSPHKIENFPPSKAYQRAKPAVASSLPNTSRMGFLVNSVPEVKANHENRRDPRLQKSSSVVQPTQKGLETQKALVSRDPRLNRCRYVNPVKPTAAAAFAVAPSAVPTATNNPLDVILPTSSLNTQSQIQRSTSALIADIRHKKITIENSTTTSEKRKKIKHRDSDYDMKEVLQAKRMRREQESTSRTAASTRSHNDKDNEKREKEKEKSTHSTKPKESTKTAESRVSQFSRSTSVLAKPVPADSVLIRILNWKPNWIQECANQSEPPPITEPLKKLKNSYESVDDYIHHFVPLLLHEVWAEIIDRHNTYNDTSVNVAMVSCDLVGEFAVMLCQVAVRKGHNYPKDGDLVCVDLPFWDSSGGQTEHSRRSKAFGYISDYTVSTITRTTSFAPRYKPPEGSHSLVKYEIRLKPRNHRLDYNSLMKVKTVSYIKPIIRNVEAVLSLKQSTLCSDILKPKNHVCKIVIPTAVKLESGEYNESQFKAIQGTVEAISRPFSFPKLLLIQGPPGTGKTHTLVGMIKKIFSEFGKNPRTPKVLVCAPSNGAIDEIGKRLAKHRKCIAGRQLKLVRIGQEKSVHPEMQRFTLETLAESNVRNQFLEEKKNFETKRKALQDKLADLDQELANHRATGNHEQEKRCQKEIHRLNKELDVHEKGGKFEDNESDMEKKKKRLKNDLLMGADVVLSTLNSCRSSIVEQIFNNSKGENGFTCVIIDEASQCTEPEILMPLVFTSISKMILIGDPMQLPATVMSKEASQHKFGTSLFERLFSYFGSNSDDENPILMLDTQYRMHPDICSFPSKQFYGNKLKTCSSVSNRQFPLRPYVVFNVINTNQNRDDPKNIFNEKEAEFVIKLLTAISERVPKTTTVGIITPYNGQKRLLEQKISVLKPKLAPQINTIDGFQGQEKDVIILSCVRSMEGENLSIGFLSSFQRINVALTRAKFTLIVCISAQALRSNELWNNLIKDATDRNCLENIGSSVAKEQIQQKIIL